MYFYTLTRQFFNYSGLFLILLIWNENYYFTPPKSKSALVSAAVISENKYNDLVVTISEKKSLDFVS